MAYDPKRARGRATPKHVIEADEPAPVDGLLDGKIEVPEWATEHDDAGIEVPVAALAESSPVAAEAPPAPEPVVEVAPVIEEPVVEAAPVVEEQVVEEQVAEVSPPREPARPARRPEPARSEPPVAPVPDTPGSRWLFVAFMVAVLVAIVWQLRRRTHR